MENRRNLSARAEKEAGRPRCSRLASSRKPEFAFQTPCGSRAVPFLTLEEPLGLLSPAGLQMRAVCAARLHKRSTLLHLNARRTACVGEIATGGHGAHFLIHSLPCLNV